MAKDLIFAVDTSENCSGAGLDASSKSTAAVSKLMKVWENRQAQQAARIGGLGLMAVSLAACGGTDEDADVLAAYNVAKTAYDTAAARSATAIAAATSAQAAADTAEDAAVSLATAQAYQTAAAAAQTAAQAAVTAATATATAAASLVAAAAATSNTADNAVAAAASASASAASASASGLLTTATAEVASAAASVASFTITPRAVAMTDGRDIIIGIDGEELTITADAGELNDNDIIDGVDSGDDTLNVTLDEDNVAPTIGGIETINIELDVIRGANATLDADDIVGATITIGSSRLGYNGEAEIDNVGDNNIVAGDNVETLTVTGVTTGVIDAGAAETVNIDATDEDDEISVIVNGDVDLSVDVAETLVITATDASSVTIVSDADYALASITADADTTLVMEAADADGVAVAGASELVISTAAATDLSGVDADVAITLAAAFNHAVTVADGASLTIGEDAEDSTLTLTAGDDDETFTLSTGFDITSLTITVATEATIVTTDDVVIGTLVTNDADVTITVDGDLEITALTSNDSITLEGEGDVEMDADIAASIDASGLTGDLAATQGAAASIVVTMGGGDLNLTLAGLTAAQEADVIGGDGDDLLDASATAGVAGAAHIIFDAGDGDDVLVLAGANNDIIEFDGGDGDDTLALGINADLSGADLTLTDVELIDLAANATMLWADIAAGTEIRGAGFAHSTLTVNGTATANTIDLTTIDLSDSGTSGAAISVAGLGGDDTIIGSDFDDTIDGGADDDTITGGEGADTITGGLGDDTFVMVLADAGDTITDFNLGDDVFDFNTALKSIGGTVTAPTGFQSGAAGTALNTTTTVFELEIATAGGTAAQLVTELGLTATNADIDAGDKLLIVNYTSGGDAQIWYFEDANGADIDAAELTLLATLVNTTPDSLTSANFI